MLANTSLHQCTSPLLSPYKEIQHGFFTRSGGVSLSPYDNLNVGFKVCDSHNKVIENISRIKNNFNNPLCISMDQVHGNTISIIDQAPPTDTIVPNTDALLTNLPKCLLMVHHADCQPLLFYDPVQRVIGCAHNGWKGSVLNIAGKTIKTMHNTFKSNPKDILVAIGPSLGPDHAQFINYKKELPQSFWSYRQEHNLFNFWKITEDQLTECGVLKQHISTAGICTFCDNRFFSYRRNHITGRNASIITFVQ